MKQFKFYIDWQDNKLRRSYFLVEAEFLGDALDYADMLMTEPGLDQYNNEEFSYPILFGSPVFIGSN